MSQSDHVADQQAAQAVVRHHSELAAALTGHVTRLIDAAGSTDEPQVWEHHEFPDHVTVLEAEHRRIETVLGAASMETPTDPGWPRAGSLLAGGPPRSVTGDSWLRIRPDIVTGFRLAPPA